jgi:Co/Zn/Cd efflux system component
LLEFTNLSENLSSGSFRSANLSFVGIVGALVITKWAWGLLSETSSILLDGGHFDDKEAELIQSVESMDETKVTRLKIWKVAPNFYSVSISAASPVLNLVEIKEKLKSLPWISHSSIEIQEMDT